MKRYRLVTESGRDLMGGETYEKSVAENIWGSLDGIYEDDDIGKEERIYIEEVK